MVRVRVRVRVRFRVRLATVSVTAIISYDVLLWQPLAVEDMNPLPHISGLHVNIKQFPSSRIRYLNVESKTKFSR